MLRFILTISLMSTLARSAPLTCNDTIINSAISLATQEKYSEARDELAKLPTLCIPTIVSKFYTGDLNRTKQCLHLFHQTLCTNFVSTLESLYREIKDHNNLANPEVLLVTSYVTAFKDMPHCSGITKLADMESQLTPHVHSILDGWASKIQQDNYQYILNVEGTAWQFKTGDRGQIEYLVNKVLDGSSNHLKLLLNFIQKIGFWETKTTAYLAVVQRLKALDKGHSDEMMAVGLLINFIMKRISAIPNAMEKLGEDFTTIKNAIPETIRNLFWKSTCTIKNLNKNEYLFATNWAREQDGGNGAVYTYTTGRTLSSGDWQLVPMHNNGIVFFQIKNQYHTSEDFYLCESRRSWRVITCKGEAADLDQWFVKPVIRDGSTKAFTIKNSMYKIAAPDYMQATDEHDVGLKSRDVQDGELVDSAYWEIECTD